MKKKLKLLLMRLMGVLPKKLPDGVNALDQFCQNILDVYSIPANDSYKNAIATMIMHLGPTVSHKPPRYFAKCVWKAQANQVAYELSMSLREKQKEKEEAEAKLKLEATTPVEVAHEEPKAI